MDVRALTVRALVERQFGGTRYCARLLEQADAERQVGGALAVALFGDVAGANGVVKLHALIGDDVGSLRAAHAEFGKATRLARLVVCELPDDAVFAIAAEVLLESGFVEEARAEELVAPGIAMRSFVRRRACGDARAV